MEYPPWEEYFYPAYDHGISWSIPSNFGQTYGTNVPGTSIPRDPRHHPTGKSLPDLATNIAYIAMERSTHFLVR